MAIAVQPSPDQLHQLAVQSRLAREQANRLREQTRELVAASRHCYAKSRQVIKDPRRVLTIDPAAAPGLPSAPTAATDRPALAGLAWGPATAVGVSGDGSGTASP